MTAEKIKDKQRTKRKPADKMKAVDLVVNKGLTRTDAAKVLGVKHNRISQILQEVNQDQNFLAFTQNKDKVFENIQYRLINLADDDLLKSMLNKRGFTDAAILQDKIQLLRGEATNIQAVDIRGLIGCVIKSHESPKVEGNEEQSTIIDVNMDNK